MGFADFLMGLLYEGNATVLPREPIADEENNKARQLLAQFDTEFRAEHPAGLPPLDQHAALWAAQAYYAACQFAMFRELETELMTSVFSELVEPEDTPANHYSVHLVFRFLPDLVRTCRSFSNTDPLTELTERWAAQWPLSSVGLGLSSELCLDCILSQPALKKMYIESVIKQQDNSRADCPAVRDGICIALGENHPWAMKLRTTHTEGKT